GSSLLWRILVSTVTARDVETRMRQSSELPLKGKIFISLVQNIHPSGRRQPDSPGRTYFCELWADSQPLKWLPSRLPQAWPRPQQSGFVSASRGSQAWRAHRKNAADIYPGSH